jgi:hypothetical protein
VRNFFKSILIHFPLIGLILIELNVILYQSIALEMIYLSSFDWNSTRARVWSKIAEKDLRSIDGADVKVSFRPFTTKRFVQLSCTQNQICRAFQELSNGYHIIEISQIVI